MSDPSNTPYEALGGEEVLSKLIDTFYSHVSNHTLLSDLFPKDLTETAYKQKQFMTQFLGGPSLYTEEFGHPMLRARHLPFPITEKHADAWLDCMQKALDEMEVDQIVRNYMMERLTLTAHHMVNQPTAP
ncbi:globin domain-containing protein [Alkalicoccobacillus murimartini]|uniref:Hemoglobin n=1 Tax=Alkalicoccobacillus murimartini TaxID=171685 RepID=A0ABT9YK41_9BACI|nr:globin [Alkalicoccobacillus murimartini]MDQ0207886.1 hemoglobin [Alkalicoccobacillus murimartini]